MICSGKYWTGANPFSASHQKRLIPASCVSIFFKNNFAVCITSGTAVMFDLGFNICFARTSTTISRPFLKQSGSLSHPTNRRCWRSNRQARIVVHVTANMSTTFGRDYSIWSLGPWSTINSAVPHEGFYVDRLHKYPDRAQLSVD